MLLAAGLSWRNDLIGIVRFIYDRCKALDVEFRFNHYVEASNLFLQKSDVVILATGGVPNLHEIEGANEFAVSDVSPPGTF